MLGDEGSILWDCYSAWAYHCLLFGLLFLFALPSKTIKITLSHCCLVTSQLFDSMFYRKLHLEVVRGHYNSGHS